MAIQRHSKGHFATESDTPAISGMETNTHLNDPMAAGGNESRDLLLSPTNPKNSVFAKNKSVNMHDITYRRS